MKTKIVSLCLVVAMAAIAIVGSTLAYLTDKDQVKNTFAVGNIDIDLWEETDAHPGMIFQNNLDYSEIMPGNELSKKPYVKNTSDKNAAYVRVAVVMNHVGLINDAIDEVYEGKGYTAEQIQAIYDEVFDGWGVNYTKRTPDTDSRRMWMDDRSSPVLFNIDTYAQLSGYGMYDINNQFLSDVEKWRNDVQPDGFIYEDEKSYYSCIENDERIYVFYLLLQPGETYQLFNGLKVPADFTEAQLKMFDGLKINIYADAIQAEGFEDDAVKAFEALQEANPLGWWNN